MKNKKTKKAAFHRSRAKDIKAEAEKRVDLWKDYDKRAMKAQQDKDEKFDRKTDRAVLVLVVAGILFWCIYRAVKSLSVM